MMELKFTIVPFLVHFCIWMRTMQIIPIFIFVLGQVTKTILRGETRRKWLRISCLNLKEISKKTAHCGTEKCKRTNTRERKIRQFIALSKK